MTISSLLSSKQITAIKDHFAAMEIKDADFDRIEVIGDLIRHIEIVDNERRQHETKGRAACNIVQPCTTLALVFMAYLATK